MTAARIPDPEPDGPEPPEGAEPTAELSEPVRVRVVALAAEALGRLPAEQLPASLRRVAAFAPGRRAKLAGGQIAGALATDHEFRERVADFVRAEAPELADALEAGTRPAAADPAEVAAFSYLLRPAGWRRVVMQASRDVGAERARVAERQDAAQLDRLRRQLEEQTAELRATRESHRERVDVLKEQNAELRRKLGHARARARASDEATQQAVRAAERAAEEASTAVSAAEAETRRLRARLEELERGAAVLRRAGRAERDEGTLRARLLLDTLLETVQGLRRELALPPVEGAPADAVVADVAEPGSRMPSGQGSLALDDPGFLEQLLNLPRTHLIVDGYNVTKNAWPESSLEAQRDRLVSGLAPLVARCGAEVTVVFDAADKEHRPPVNRPRGVRVLFSPVGVIADEVIRQLVAAEPPGRPLVVVSTDQEVARDAARAGARSVAARALTRLLARA